MLDDVQGLSLGVFLCGFGVHLLTQAGLVTGQTAGVAVILSYLTGYSFGVTFFAVNLPFYLLAWRRLGAAFTVKSLVSVTMLSIVAEMLPDYITITDPDPVFAAVAFGALGVIALIVQDTTGFRAGWVQLMFDAVIFGVALFILPLSVVGYSLIGAVVLNLVITINHRRDRYIAT